MSELSPMDEDALMAMGTILAALGGILERRGVCTVMEMAETIGSVAVMTSDSGPQYERRAQYIGECALMLKAAAEGAARLQQN